MKFIVLRPHENVLHSGLENSLANVRLNYWIIKGRQFVKKALKQCYVCKLIQGKFLHAAENSFSTKFSIELLLSL